MLCPWSNLLSCVDSLATVGGPVVVATQIWPPRFLSFFFISLFYFTWPCAVESFPCPGDALVLGPSWFLG